MKVDAIPTPVFFLPSKDLQVFACELVLGSTFGTTYGKDSGRFHFEDKSQESVVHDYTPETTIGTPKPAIVNTLVLSRHTTVFR
jgi:hypothetical protein